MKKRFDYHSHVTAYKLICGINLFCVVVSVYLQWTGKNRLLHELAGVFISSGIMFVVSLIGYYDAKTTYIELDDDGILFSGIFKKVYSPWQEVREIKTLGRISRLCTANGSFFVRVVEPSGHPKLSMIKMMKEHSKFNEELMGEIKRRAPNAKITLSVLPRPI